MRQALGSSRHVLVALWQTLGSSHLSTFFLFSPVVSPGRSLDCCLIQAHFFTDGVAVPSFLFSCGSLADEVFVFFFDRLPLIFLHRSPVCNHRVFFGRSPLRFALMLHSNKACQSCWKGLWPASRKCETSRQQIGLTPKKEFMTVATSIGAGGWVAEAPQVQLSTCERQ